MALASGWRWDRRRRSFVPFTAMEGATDGCVCVISEASPTLLPSPGVPNPSCVGLWDRGRVKRAGEGRRSRASPGTAQQVVSSGEILQEASVDLGSYRGRSDGTALPAPRCVGSSGSWAMVPSPAFAGWTFPGAGSLCPGVPASPCRVVGERSAGLGEGSRGTYSSARRSLSIL